MVADAFPDTEGACRAWLRATSSVTALVGSRSFFSVPDDADEDDYPMVTVERVGGGEDGSEAAIDVAVLQLKIHGKRRGKAAAHAIKSAIRSELRAIRSPVAWTPTVTCYGAHVESDLYLQDPQDRRPAYVLTVTVTATVTSGT